MRNEFSVGRCRKFNGHINSMDKASIFTGVQCIEHEKNIGSGKISLPE